MRKASIDMAKISHDLVMAVREMLDRHWSVADMAARLNIDPEDVRTILEIINQMLT